MSWSNGLIWWVTILIVYIKSADRIKKGRNNYNPLDEALRDTQKISANYRYIETWVNMSADTFKHAIQNENYIKKMNVGLIACTIFTKIHY